MKRRNPMIHAFEEALATVYMLYMLGFNEKESRIVVLRNGQFCINIQYKHIEIMIPFGRVPPDYIAELGIQFDEYRQKINRADVIRFYKKYFTPAKKAEFMANLRRFQIEIPESVMN